jgi:hypothetical protein
MELSADDEHRLCKYGEYIIRRLKRAGIDTSELDTDTLWLIISIAFHTGTNPAEVVRGTLLFLRPQGTA